MFYKTLEAWRATRRGRALLTLWGVVFVGVTARAAVLRSRRKAGKGKRSSSSTRTSTPNKTIQDGAGRNDGDELTAKDAVGVADGPSSGSGSSASPSQRGGGSAECQKPQASAGRRRLREAIRLAFRGPAKPGKKGSRSYSAHWYALLLTGTVVARMFAQISLSRQIGVMGACLARRDWPAVYKAQRAFAMIAIPTAALGALVSFSKDRLALSMRSNLVGAVHDAYAAAVPASAVTTLKSVEEPDARVTADARALGTELTSLFYSVFKPTVEVCLLSVSLSRMMGAKQLLQCYAIFGLLGGWSKWVSPSFRFLTSAVAEEEAKFRSAHSTAALRSEEIEALKGRPVEVLNMQRRYSELTRVVRSHQLQSSLSEALDTYVVRHVGTLAAFTAMMPAVFQSANNQQPTPSEAERVSPFGRVQDPTEYFLTCLHLLVNVGVACRELIQSFRHIAAGRALSTRVLGLIESYQRSSDEELNQPLSVEPGTFHVEDLTVVVPSSTEPSHSAGSGLSSGRVLVENMSFALTPGRSILIAGDNGTGKSTLLKLLAGVLTPTKGTISRPPPCEFMYLPQTPYLPAFLTLRGQLLYPGTPSPSSSTVESGLSGSELPSARATAGDRELLSVLEFVGLGELVKHCPGGLDGGSPELWAGLSLGQKQRLSLARVLLKCPKVALLDEPTSGVPEEFELQVFRKLQEKRITMLTVSHRPGVCGYHSAVLGLHGDGNYSMTEVVLGEVPASLQAVASPRRRAVLL